MSKKRMFSQDIINSDAFMDMPLSTQALYFHLGMNADDDGFVNNPKMLCKLIGASADDLTLLKAKNFIISFDSGIVVIKHWYINNYIRNDRYHETKYLEEKARLQLKENGSYTLGIPNGYQMDTEIRLDKIRLDKNRIINNKEIKEGDEEKIELFDYDWIGDTSGS